MSKKLKTNNIFNNEYLNNMNLEQLLRIKIFYYNARP